MRGSSAEGGPLKVDPKPSLTQVAVIVMAFCRQHSFVGGISATPKALNRSIGLITEIPHHLETETCRFVSHRRLCRQCVQA